MRKLSFPKDHMYDIERYLKREILHSHEKHGERKIFPLVIRANNNTMKSEIKYACQINFTKSRNIGSLLKFCRISCWNCDSGTDRTVLKYHQRKYFSSTMWSRVYTAISACTRYTSFYRSYHQDIKYQKNRRIYLLIII